MTGSVASLSSNEPLFLLAVDQRGWLSNALWDMPATDRPTGDRAEDMKAIKTLVAEGLIQAKRPVRGRCGILVDSEFGIDALDQMSSYSNIAVCIPIEKNNRFPLELENDWESVIEHYDPYLVKILVWHNPDEADGGLDVQLARLERTFKRLESLGRSTLLEVLVPPTVAQLSSVGGSRDRYDAELLPRLLNRALADITGAGVFPNVWKLEGLESEEDAKEVLRTLRSRSPHPCNALVLGRNAMDSKVDNWLRVSARSGYAGFAIGRSIWWDAVTRWREGEIGREDAVDIIAGRYARFCEQFLNGQAE